MTFLALHETFDHLLEGHARTPTRITHQLGWVADSDGAPPQRNRPILYYVPGPIQSDCLERYLNEVLHGVLLAGGDDEIIRLGVIHDEVHGANVVLGMTPVAAGRQATERKMRPRPGTDLEGCPDHLLGKEPGRTQVRCVVVEDSAGGKYSVGVPIGPVREHSARLGQGVDRVRLQRRGFVLKLLVRVPE